MTYTSSNELEVALWLMWVSLQKEETVCFSVSGFKFARSPEALEFDRHSCDALKAGAEAVAYKIVRRVEQFVSYDLEGSHVGLESSMPFGSGAWRQSHFEHMSK